jgi:hypothetical protein
MIENSQVSVAGEMSKKLRGVAVQETQQSTVFSP